MYGFYTSKVIFVAHRCARCTRFQVLDGGGARRAAGGARVHKAVGSGEALARMQEQQQINISPGTIKSRQLRDGRTKK